MSLNIAVGIEIFYPQINGLITTSMNLLRNFKAMGHNPVIITPRVVKNMPNEMGGIPIFYLPSTDALTYPGLRLVNTSSPLFKSVIEEYNIDIVQSTAPWFVGMGLHNVAKKKNIPMVNTFHTNLHNIGYVQYVAPFMVNKHTVNFLERSAWSAARPFLKPCDVLVAPSPNTCQDLRQQFPKKRIEWIPNGVQIDMFTYPENTEFMSSLIPEIIEKKNDFALFIGRLAQEKSVDILLEATALAVKKIPDFRLVLVGDGPKRKDYQKLAKDLDLANYVFFLGKIEHEILLRSGLLHKAKFFTTASITETHSMTVTEALCCSIPVVVANHPSMTYFTEGTALYFEPNNPESAAQAFIDMWTKEEVYAPRKKASQHCLESFDGAHIAQQYIELYEELLAKKKIIR